MANVDSIAASIVGRKGSPEERFWQSVNMGAADECWNWKHACGRGGYGRLGIGKKTIYSHRFSWGLHRGPIPDAMLVCHKCDNPRCVNPDHLFLGDHIANNSDRAKKGRNRNQSGGLNNCAILSDDQARQIFVLYEEGRDAKSLGWEFGVATGTVSDLVSGRGWAHLMLPASMRLAKKHRFGPGFDLNLFATKLRAAGKQDGFTASAISRATGVPVTVVCRTLRSEKVPNIANVTALAKWMNLTTADFMQPA